MCSWWIGAARKQPRSRSQPPPPTSRTPPFSCPRMPRSQANPRAFSFRFRHPGSCAPRRTLCTNCGSPLHALGTYAVSTHEYRCPALTRRALLVEGGGSFFGYDENDDITSVQRGIVSTVVADLADLGVPVQVGIAATVMYGQLVSQGFFATEAAASGSALGPAIADGTKRLPSTHTLWSVVVTIVTDGSQKTQNTVWASSLRSGILHRTWRQFASAASPTNGAAASMPAAGTKAPISRSTSGASVVLDVTRAVRPHCFEDEGRRC